MTVDQALEALTQHAMQAMADYAGTLDASDPDTWQKLTAYSDKLRDWLDEAMSRIRAIAAPQTIH